MRQRLPLLSAWTLAGVLALATSWSALNRYREFRSAYAWDLAYYNQWFWALTRGDGRITVRPVAWYAVEGPSVWKMNYLAPVRFLIAPVYRIWPDPRTLLIIQNLAFWWVVPAAFTLVRVESAAKGPGLALAAAALVPLTPLVWPLVANDFRELQLAPAFVLGAIAGWRARRIGLTSLGICGLLACRQEFALLVASLSLVPPREPEPRGRSARWGLVVVGVGVAWGVAFLAYLWLMVSHEAPWLFLMRFGGGQTEAKSIDWLGATTSFLLIGMGSWAILAALAPRIAVLSIPWVLLLIGGGWNMPRLALADDWHHVRYCAPAAAVLLAAGLIGFARAASWLQRRGGGWTTAALAVTLAIGCVVPSVRVIELMSRVPRTILDDEAATLWRSIERVGPEDGVLACYDVAAAVASRRILYSNYAPVNYPPGFPVLGPEIRWLFLRRDLFRAELYERQGFTAVERGRRVWVLRRE